MRSVAKLILAVVWLSAPRSLVADNAKFILPPTAYVLDPFASTALDPADVAEANPKEAETRFPGAAKVLESGDRILPNEPVTLLVPVLTVVRITETARPAGIREYTAIAGGGVSLIDPWSGDTAGGGVSRNGRTAVAGSGRADSRTNEGGWKAVGLCVPRGPCV